MSLFKKKKDRGIDQLVELAFSLRTHGDIAGRLSLVFTEDSEYLRSIRDELHSLYKNLLAHIESKGVVFPTSNRRPYNNPDNK